MSNTSKWKSLFSGWGLAIVYFVVGFTFFLAELSFYGESLFIILPAIVGVSAGLLPFEKYAFVGAILGLLAFFAILVLGHYEGFACLIYTVPIALVALVIGTVISTIVKRNTENKSKTLKFFILPILLYGGSALVERSLDRSVVINSVSTSMYLPYSCEEVWDHIKSVDTLDTQKPFWLKMGLPVPQKCLLEAEHVGARRICYFEEGRIEEEVTELHKPFLLKMKVTNYDLPGIKWLTFKDAIYTFHPRDQGTVITRITTYTSLLAPRFYWSLCEQSAIKSEHDYVLNDLKRRLNER